MSHDTPIKVCMCLRCGHMFETSTNMTGKRPPKPGDYSLCISCGCLLQFRQDMSISLVNEEAAFISMNPAQRSMFIKLRLAIIEINPFVSRKKGTIH